MEKTLSDLDQKISEARRLKIENSILSTQLNENSLSGGNVRDELYFSSLSKFRYVLDTMFYDMMKYKIANPQKTEKIQELELRFKDLENFYKISDKILFDVKYYYFESLRLMKENYNLSHRILELEKEIEMSKEIKY